MWDVVIIRSNSLENDTRVFKISKSLSKRYLVSALGWNREGRNTDHSGIPVHRNVLGIRAPIGKPSLVLYYPLFWVWIFVHLVISRPKFVHACDLDTALPAILYKLIFRKKMIFDIFDRYAMAYIPQKYGFLYKIVNKFEEYIGTKSDALITVGDQLLESLNAIPSIYDVIMNCPEDQFVEKEAKPGSYLTLVYTGNIVTDRGLEIISKAIQDLNGVKLILAGRVLDNQLMEDLKKNKNIIYKGVLSLEQASKLESKADVMIIIYNPVNILNRMAMPNKLFISMMHGIPVITNLAKEIIIESNHGILVNYFDINEVQNAVVRLRDDDQFRCKLGQNGRNCFLQKYNWEVMENRLFKIYLALKNHV